MQKLDTEEYISRARKIHGDTYDYSETCYVRSTEKLKILCKVHGAFYQSPQGHLAGHGCRKCGIGRVAKQLQLSQEQFISAVIGVHGDKYSLAHARYAGRGAKVDVGCPVHGRFLISADSLLSGHGCRQCAVSDRASALRKTTASFIAESKARFGDKFSYQEAEYRGRTEKLSLLCSCGTRFLVAPVVHLAGNGGCPACFERGAVERTLVPFETFVERSRAVHGDRYSYIEAAYKGISKKAGIVCKEHGEFVQAAFSHLAGKGCRKCGVAARAASRLAAGKSMAERKLVALSKAQQNALYSYDVAAYIGNDKPITIVCEKHGEFLQVYGNHVRGAGCPKCAKDRGSAALRYDFDTFVCKAAEIHGDRYRYDEASFSSLNERLTIICKEHGEFVQRGAEHLSGHGCPACGRNATSLSRRVGWDEFLARAVKVHGDRYLYSKEGFTSVSESVRVVCRKHGEFYQYAQDHLGGGNCPRCAVQVSAYEDEVRSLLERSGLDVMTSVVGLLPSTKELDIVVVSSRLAVEIDGLRWHSEKCGRGRTYHQDKTDEAARVGYSLIHITDLQWKTRREAVESLLMARCGVVMQKLDARKCRVACLAASEMRKFMERCHIQGFRPGKEYLGLRHQGVLVAAASFGFSKAKEAELQRYATLPGSRVRGGLGKLVEHWRRAHATEPLISFCDTAHFDGKAYAAVGFLQEKVLPPDYGYTDGIAHYSKEAFRKAQQAKRFANYDPALTEKENAENNGWYRIWGCNKIKFKLPALQDIQ